jgi:hypothetical protein
MTGIQVDREESPKEWTATDDCGVSICGMASIYVKRVREHDLLTNSGKVEETMLLAEITSRNDKDMCALII